MKTELMMLAAGLVCAAATARAQPGPMGGPAGPNINAATAKLFGDNQAFSANLQLQTRGPRGEMTIPGILAFDHGKSRFEMDMAQMKGSQIPPGAGERMKAMGMDKMIVIARPDKQLRYLIYPGLQAYTQMPLTGQEATASPEDFKLQTTRLGTETLDGHECVKNQELVTDKEGQTNQALVWNATDLKNFPLKLELMQPGHPSTMQFSNVKLAPPDAAAFEPPAGLTKYDNFMTLMQQSMMKRMGPGSAGGFPPPAPPAAPSPSPR
jgi:hypothetical protein